MNKKAATKSQQKKVKRRPLTVKQEKFVDAVVATGNGTQAAIRAGYSENGANVIASKNLAKPDIAACIGQRLAALRSYTANEGLGALVEYSRGNISDFFDEDGTFLSLLEIRERNLGHLIKSIEFCQKPGGDVEIVGIELYDAMAASAKLLSFVIKGHKLSKQEERNQEFYEAMVKELTTTFKLPREKVIQDIIQRRPEAAKYLLKGH